MIENLAAIVGIIGVAFTLFLDWPRFKSRIYSLFSGTSDPKVATPTPAAIRHQSDESANQATSDREERKHTVWLIFFLLLIFIFGGELASNFFHDHPTIMMLFLVIWGVFTLSVGIAMMLDKGSFGQKLLGIFFILFGFIILYMGGNVYYHGPDWEPSFMSYLSTSNQANLAFHI